ncbi:hypothetical protein IAI18_11920 [Acetobacteraceae bacterium H6797]|nr:hypothetical protein [Acetobacteraceae bacterium H6797]
MNTKTAKPAKLPEPEPGTEEEIAYLAKRHRVSAAIIREIIRSIGSSERSAVEREIKRGRSRR